MVLSRDSRVYHQQCYVTHNVQVNFTAYITTSSNICLGLEIRAARLVLTH